MNLLKIGKEAIEISKEKKYEKNGQTIFLPDFDVANVKVYSPEKGEELMQQTMIGGSQQNCRIIVTNEDSFQAARRYEHPLVMNFANAHKAGGGFLLGATAQEEVLCRCSTLYASISSNEAAEMYKYNNSHLSRVESDYMLLSEVCIFRDEKYELLDKPVMAGVVTMAAPNRIGAAMFASKKLIDETMTRRIKIMLLAAKENNYKNLILGAWGCGAFHNDPEHVATCFKNVIVDQGYGRYFDEICFAIYGKEDGKNISIFRKILG